MDALIAKHPKISGAITFAACDNGVLYGRKFFNCLRINQLTSFSGVSVHPGAARHTKYGWIESDGDDVRGVSVNAPSDPKMMRLLQGLSPFEVPTFLTSLSDADEAGETVNGEYYLDSLVNMTIKASMTCKLLEVDNYRVGEHLMSCQHFNTGNLFPQMALPSIQYMW